MRFWFFTESPYPNVPDPRDYDSIRVTFPNRHYEPRLGADIWHRNLDLYLHADEVGLDMMVNEHHSTPTCIDPAPSVISGALARQTNKARLLQLGNPVANRSSPLRIAEETAMVDVISRGRLEVGMIRGTPYEILPANSNPVGTTQRMWEAHDLIKAAWTSHDGPFNFEGEYFHYRQVNIFPRPYQDPHPPIWFVAMNPGTNVTLAEHEYVSASFLLGYDTRPLFDVYRKRWLELGHTSAAPLDKFAIMCLIYVGDTEAEARRGAEQVAWFVNGPGRKIPTQFANPPGYSSAESTVKNLRRAAAGASAVAGGQAMTRAFDVESMNQRGTLIYGTPDSVYEQLLKLYKAVGGFGHLLAHAHAGHMEYGDTARSLTLLGKEVLPRLAQAELEIELDSVSPELNGIAE